MVSISVVTAFSRHALHLLYRAPVTITRLVTTVLPQRRCDSVMLRNAYLVEMSSPASGTRVPFNLAGDVAV